MSDLRKEWQELQESKARVRPFFNNARGVLERQPLKDLLRAPREQKKRELRGQEKLGTK